MELAGTAPSFSLRILYTCSNLLISSWGWPRIAPCSGSAKFCTPLCWQGQAGGILHFDLAFALDLNRDIRNAVRRPNSLEGSSGNVRPSSCFAGRAGLQHECEHAFEDRRMQCRTSVASSTALRGQRQRSTRRRVHVRVRVRVCAWVHACVWACGRVGVCACAGVRQCAGVCVWVGVRVRLRFGHQVRILKPKLYSRHPFRSRDGLGRIVTASRDTSFCLCSSFFANFLDLGSPLHSYAERSHSAMPSLYVPIAHVTFCVCGAL